MPAANVGAMTPGSPDIERVATVMKHRMNCVFALTASIEARYSVLGAWGCGVFRNDPDLIARLFAKCLSGPDSWAVLRPHCLRGIRFDSGFQKPPAI
jgi:uncharacterized protein (TIGR02452 family)